MFSVGLNHRSHDVILLLCIIIYGKVFGILRRSILHVFDFSLY